MVQSIKVVVGSRLHPPVYITQYMVISKIKILVQIVYKDNNCLLVIMF